MTYVNVVGAVLSLLMLAACGEWQGAGDQPGLRDPTAGAYEFVDVTARLQGQRMSIRLENHGPEMCFWSINLPRQSGANGVALGITGLRRDGEPLGSRGPDIPLWSDKVVFRRGQGQTFSIDLQETFGARVSDEDCIFFDALYFDCSVAEHYAEPAPAEERGLAQGTWIVRNARLVPAPSGQQSCRARYEAASQR